jgi:hypothetical protein
VISLSIWESNLTWANETNDKKYKLLASGYRSLIGVTTENKIMNKKTEEYSELEYLFDEENHLESCEEITGIDAGYDYVIIVTSKGRLFVHTVDSSEETVQ